MGLFFFLKNKLFAGTEPKVLGKEDAEENEFPAARGAQTAWALMTGL